MLFYFALCLFCELRRLMYVIEVVCAVFNVFEREIVLAVRTESERARARTHTLHGIYVIINRHQVFNIRNENEATTNARICYVYRLNDVTNVCLTVHICNTIDFAFVAGSVVCVPFFRLFIGVVAFLFFSLFSILFIVYLLLSVSNLSL